MKHRAPLITLVVTLGALVLILSLNDALIPKPGTAPGPAASPAPSATGKPLTSPDAVFVGPFGFLAVDYSKLEGAPWRHS